MKNAVRLSCLLLSVASVGFSSHAFAQDASGPNAYQQRYGADLSPLPVATQSHTATAVEEVDPFYGQDAAENSPFNAYQQRYGVSSSSAPTMEAPSGKRAELNIASFYDNDPSSNVNGGSSYGLETTVYSATLDNSWRLFAGELYSHELEPDGEGHINYSRTSTGVEYDNHALRGSLAPTFNSYNGNERVGADGEGTWFIDNNWAVGGGAQLFSRDIPLRALNAGITSNSYDLMADWYQDNVRDLRVNADLMNFSDNNLRTSIAAVDTEHLYATRHFQFDGLASVYESQNSENEFRSYFNPRQDVLGTVGAKLGQPLYKGFGIACDHSLEVKPGVYWQQNYGGSPTITASYSQHVNFKDNVDASAGVIFTRQSSDGTGENDLAFSLNVTKKF